MSIHSSIFKSACNPSKVEYLHRVLSRGYTLLELLITISVMSIVMAITVPGAREAIEQNTLTRDINELIFALNFARSEAVKRGLTVTLCKSNDGSSCGGTGVEWENGWVVFVNEDNDTPAVIDAGETILRISNGLDANRSLRGSGVAVSSVSFNATGELADSGIMVLCQANDLTRSRAVLLGITGYARSSRRDSSGIPLDGSNSQITTCTPV